jgi:tRNA(Ile)-lysidine synthase
VRSRSEIAAAVDAVFGALPELRTLGGPVVVAVSGGADSLALLAASVAAGLDPIAVYVDHGLRDGSERDGATVATIAASMGAESRIERVHLETGGNLEARARAARYECLERVCRETGADSVLVGHTADDQAETVLLALLRGSGSPGLGAMAPRRGAIVRPLLERRRAQTIALCARLGLVPVVDPMNFDAAFRRVWIRREVLPALERAAERDLVPVLVRQAAVLREESALLDELAVQAWPDPADRDSAGRDRPMAKTLNDLPRALARRAVRLWLGAPPRSLAEIDAVLGVAANRARAVQLAGGRRVRRREGRLIVERVMGDADPPDSVVDVNLPGSVAGLGFRIESWVERDAPVHWPDGCSTCVVDADVVGGAARLRRRPSNGRVVLTAPTGEPIWTVGYRIDGRVRVGERTRRYLWISALPERTVPK